MGTVARNRLKLESQTMFKLIKKTKMQRSNLFDVTELTMLTAKDIDILVFVCFDHPNLVYLLEDLWIFGSGCDVFLGWLTHQVQSSNIVRIENYLEAIALI